MKTTPWLIISILPLIPFKFLLNQLFPFAGHYERSQSTNREAPGLWNPHWLGKQHGRSSLQRHPKLLGVPCAGVPETIRVWIGLNTAVMIKSLAKCDSRRNCISHVTFGCLLNLGACTKWRSSALQCSSPQEKLFLVELFASFGC